MSGKKEIDIQWFIFELPQIIEPNVNTAPMEECIKGLLLKNFLESTNFMKRTQPFPCKKSIQLHAYKKLKTIHIFTFF